jgi:hypothetical protein
VAELSNTGCSELRFELFVGYKEVSLGQSEGMFFHFFGKVTEVELVVWADDSNGGST